MSCIRESSVWSEFHDRYVICRNILFYLRKKTQSKITTVENDGDIEKHLHQNRPVVVAHFRSNQSLKYRFFEDAVKEMDDVDCLCGFGENKMTLPIDSLEVTSSEGRLTQFTGTWNVEELKRFIATYSLPLVIEYSPYWSRFIFSGDHGIRQELVYISDSYDLYDESEVKSVLEDIASAHQGEIITVMMNAGQTTMMKYFGFNPEDLPILFYVRLSPHHNGIGGHGSNTPQEVRLLRRHGG